VADMEQVSVVRCPGAYEVPLVAKKLAASGRADAVGQTLRVNGVPHYLWRAVDQDGNILDILVQRRRDKHAAKKFFRKLLKGLTYVPRVVITDKLKSYGAAMRELARVLRLRLPGPNTSKTWGSIVCQELAYLLRAFLLSLTRGCDSPLSSDEWNAAQACRTHSSCGTLVINRSDLKWVARLANAPSAI
jgi:hypothetical protein